jgi:hypothetical protein
LFFADLDARLIPIAGMPPEQAEQAFAVVWQELRRRRKANARGGVYSAGDRSAYDAVFRSGRPNVW